MRRKVRPLIFGPKTDLFFLLVGWPRLDFFFVQRAVVFEPFAAARETKFRKKKSGFFGRQKEL